MTFNNLVKSLALADANYHLNNKKAEVLHGVNYATEIKDTSPNTVYIGEPSEITSLIRGIKDPDGFDYLFISTGSSNQLLKLVEEKKTNLVTTNTIPQTVFNTCAARFMRILTFEHHLNQLSLSESSFDELLRYVSEITFAALFVLNTGYKIVYRSTYSLNYGIEYSEISSALINQLQDKSFLNNVEFDNISEIPSAAVKPLYYGATIIGYLIAVYPNIVTMDMGSSFLDTALPAIAKSSGFEGSSRGFNAKFNQFVVDLIEKKVTRTQEITERIKSINWISSKRYSCIVVQQSTPDKRALNYLLYTMQIEFPNINISVYHDDLVLTIPLKERYIPLLDDKRFYGFLEKNDLYAGASYSLSDLKMFSTIYQSSLAALDFGRRLEIHNPRKRIFKYEEYRFLHIIRMVMSDSNIEYHNKDIGYLTVPDYMILKRYDKNNDDNLLKIYLEYIKANSNCTLAAEHTYVHRNTIKRKLEKIEELTGRNIDDYYFQMMMLFSSYVDLYSKEIMGIDVTENNH